MSNQKMIYEVVILKTNGDHIRAIESDNYDKCYDKWKDLHLLWATSSKEQKPFILEEPIVTAFNPAMIYEISLIPVMGGELSSKSHNPYQKAMQEQGFSRTFPGQGRDLLG